MKDGPGRRLLKAAARGLWSLEVGVSRVIQRRRGLIPFVLGGECRRCARCCEEPAIRVRAPTWYLPTIRRIFLRWQEAVNGFVRVGEDSARRVFRFRCTHFDPATRSCDSYDSRPGICRDYPRGLLNQGAPDFFPECGFRPVARNAASMIESLRKRNLPPEQFEQLKRDLFLE